MSIYIFTYIFVYVYLYVQVNATYLSTACINTDRPLAKPTTGKDALQYHNRRLPTANSKATNWKHDT